ncbi:MAG: cupin domain-containing protein [Chloroflexi bacterium]|nr:cupin domain-containing protein [Chloroflexota bacterium]
MTTAEGYEATGRRERTASPYRQWQDTQGIPIYTGSFVEDLYSLKVEPWALVGQKGAFVNLADQETSDGWVIEIAPAGNTTVIHHLCEATIFVLEGRGATTFWQEGSPKESVEWKRGSIVAPPLNCYYQHFNGDGGAPARLLVVTSAPLVLNQFRHPEFLFNDTFVFDQRFDGSGSYFSAPSERLGPFRWRTNFVPDIRTHAVEPKPHRGQDNVGVNFTMSNNSMAVAASEFPPGSYKMAHRHSVGAYVFILSGTGFSLLRWEGEAEARRVDWKDGCMLSPKEGEFHQHFNTGDGPARYLKIRPGALNAEHWDGGGPEQIDYADEDPAIYEAYAAECRRNGREPFPHPGKAKKAQS